MLSMMGLGVASGSNLMGLVDFELGYGFCVVSWGGLHGGSQWFVGLLVVVVRGFGRFQW